MLNVKDLFMFYVVVETSAECTDIQPDLDMDLVQP